MLPSNCREFIAVQTRLQSYASGKINHGWVDAVEPKSILILLNPGWLPVVGERCLLEVHGEMHFLTFDAEYVERVPAQRLVRDMITRLGCSGATELDSDWVTQWKPVSSPRIASPVEPFRKKLVGEIITMIVNGEEVESVLSDIGQTGLGIECPMQLHKGDSVAFRYHAVTAVIELVGEVEECRNSTSVSKFFRMEVSVQPKNRIEAGKWSNLFQVGVTL